MGKTALYEIEHVTRYLYTSPVRHCVLLLCLKPRHDEAQRLFSFDVTTDPPAPLTSELDFFGNTKQVLTVHRAHHGLEIVSRSTVERSPTAPLPSSLGAVAWNEILSWRGSSRHWSFMYPSAFARPSQTLTAFVDKLGIKPGDDPLESLRRLSDTLSQRFQYVPGSTSVVSPIEHILETGQGVCQDYAHVMIAIVRSWHVPARYVSGYLCMAGNSTQDVPQRASHAWVECRLPDLGWVGFDPTNRCLADQRHVRVAVGRDYQDVAPVRGVFDGGGESQLAVDVRVRAT